MTPENFVPYGSYSSLTISDRSHERLVVVQELEREESHFFFRHFIKSWYSEVRTVS